MKTATKVAFRLNRAMVIEAAESVIGNLKSANVLTSVPSAICISNDMFCGKFAKEVADLELADPLAGFVSIPQVTKVAYTNAVLHERLGWLRITDMGGLAREDRQRAVSHSIRVAQFVLGGLAESRRRPVRTENGSQIAYYADHCDIDKLMHDADETVSVLHAKDEIISAVFAYCAILHCHPFNDCNKRSARIAYHILASPPAASNDLTCFPITAMRSLDPVSFDLKVRRAIILNDWVPVFLAAKALAGVWSRAVTSRVAI